MHGAYAEESIAEIANTFSYRPQQWNFEVGRSGLLLEALGPFEYDRAGTVLALARQYSRSHVRMALRERVSMYWKAHKLLQRTSRVLV